MAYRMCPRCSQCIRVGKVLNKADDHGGASDTHIGHLLPIVFAMANPDQEIAYPLAVKTRKDVIMATGRSDYPNQVNNVLGFPYIFRGALDVRATSINEKTPSGYFFFNSDLDATFFMFRLSG